MPAACLLERGSGSALAELELLTSAGLTGLLTFFLTAVARQEARLLECLATLVVLGDQRARDAVTNGLGLGAVAAAGDHGLDVVLVGELEQLQRLTGDHHSGLPLEVRADGLLVDGALTGTRRNPDARDCGLALASGVNLGVTHGLISDAQGLGLLCSVGVIRSGVDLELGDELTSEDVLGKHALDRNADGQLGLLDQGLVELEALHAAGI